MVSVKTHEVQVLNVFRNLPGVLVIMPFEPKMMLKADLEHKLTQAYRQVENELQANYPHEKADPVLKNLQTLIKTLDYGTWKKSVGIFVSPLIEKVYYLDIPVEEKIIIDESFEIRDLVYSKKEIHKYLVLVAGADRSRLFLGNTTQFVRLASNMPHQLAAYKNDVPEQVTGIIDTAHRKEVLLDKFLRHVDNGLDIILKAYKLPLFVMGAEKPLAHFKKVTHHLKNITGFVPGQFEDLSEPAIRNAIAPHVADWKKVVQNDLMLRLDAAMGAHKLAMGIHDVWKNASRGKGRLLIVEKNYIVAAHHGPHNEIIEEHGLPAIADSVFIKDAVDDVIEKVLSEGGDVEFVDEGMLTDYDHIALIEHY